MTMSKPFLTIWLASLTLMVTACDNGPQSGGQKTSGPNPEASSPAGNAIDPCSLLTAAEIEATLGWKVAKTEPKSYGATGNCTYTSANPYGRKGMEQVSILIGQGMPDMSSAGAMAQWRLKQYEGPSYKDIGAIVEPVEGLGVPAIRNEVAGLLTLEMAVGKQLVSVGVFGSLEQARALGEKALARIK
jgi:hypothetical protein